MLFSIPEAQTSSGETEVNPAEVKGMIPAQGALVLEVNISEGSPGINPPERLQAPKTGASTP